jgi:hypothetical protein
VTRPHCTGDVCTRVPSILPSLLVFVVHVMLQEATPQPQVLPPRRREMPSRSARKPSYVEAPAEASAAEDGEGGSSGSDDGTSSGAGSGKENEPEAEAAVSAVDGLLPAAAAAKPAGRRGRRRLSVASSHQAAAPPESPRSASSEDSSSESSDDDDDNENVAPPAATGLPRGKAVAQPADSGGAKAAGSSSRRQVLQGQPAA